MGSVETLQTTRVDPRVFGRPVVLNLQEASELLGDRRLHGTGKPRGAGSRLQMENLGPERLWGFSG